MNEHRGGGIGLIVGGNIMGNDEVLFIGADRRGLSPPIWYIIYSMSHL